MFFFIVLAHGVLFLSHIVFVCVLLLPCPLRRNILFPHLLPNTSLVCSCVLPSCIYTIVVLFPEDFTVKLIFLLPYWEMKE